MNQKSQGKALPANTGHGNHCFVVMPFGRDPTECRWFKDRPFTKKVVYWRLSLNFNLLPLLIVQEPPDWVINLVW